MVVPLIANTYNEARQLLRTVTGSSVGVNIGHGYGVRVMVWITPRTGLHFLDKLEENDCKLPIVSRIETAEGLKVLIGAEQR